MTGKRIVFCTFGSLGDIHPFLALSQELKRRGHFPVIATTPCYRQRIEAEGIEFHPVRPEIDVTDPAILRRVMDRRTGGRYVTCDILLPALRESYEDTAAAAAGADLLVTHPVALSAILLARKTAIPWASVALAPMSLYSTYDPPVLPGIPFAERLVSLGPSFQKRLLSTVAFLFEPQWKPYRRFEKELGLPLSPNPCSGATRRTWCLACSLRCWLRHSPTGRPTPAQQDFLSTTIAKNTQWISNGFLIPAIRPSSLLLAPQRWEPQAISFSRALMRRAASDFAPCYWLGAIRAISPSGNCREE